MEHRSSDFGISTWDQAMVTQVCRRCAQGWFIRCVVSWWTVWVRGGSRWRTWKPGGGNRWGPPTWSLVQASGRGSHPPRIHRRTNRRMVACHGQVRPWATSGWRRSRSLPVGFGPQARRYGLGSKRPFSCRAGVGLPAIGAESCRAERQSCPRRDRMLGKGQRSEAWGSGEDRRWPLPAIPSSTNNSECLIGQYGPSFGR